MSRFRLALSHDFLRPDGRPTFPEIDFGRLDAEAGLDYEVLGPARVYEAARLAGFDALILLGSRITPASFEPAGRLALVARFGVGYDNVDLDAATAADAAVVITPDGVRRPVAVAVMTLLLALANRLPAKDRMVREGRWAERTACLATGLVGRTLGALGMGSIGAEVFRLARPFGLDFIACDPYTDAAVAAELGVRLVDLDTLFATSDFLSVSCPLTAQTRGLVNAERLAGMKPTAYLINTARGPVVDQAALARALADGRIAGAGLDVLAQEPPAADDPLLGLDNVILTPHTLCSTDQMRAGCWGRDVDAVLDLMHGRAPANTINRAVLDRPGFRGRLADYRARFGD